MAISRKPRTQEPPLPLVNVEALIAKGGSVAHTIPPTVPPVAEIPQGPGESEPEKGVTSFTLRVPGEILETLDAHRKKQVYKVPRQQWILEAIMQRLEREMLPHAPQDS